MANHQLPSQPPPLPWTPAEVLLLAADHDPVSDGPWKNDILRLVDHTCQHYPEQAVLYYLGQYGQGGVDITAYPQTGHIGRVSREVRRRLSMGENTRSGSNGGPSRHRTRRTTGDASPYPISQGGRTYGRTLAPALPRVSASGTSFVSRRSARHVSTTSTVDTELDNLGSYSPFPAFAELEGVEDAPQETDAAISRPKRAAAKSGATHATGHEANTHATAATAAGRGGKAKGKVSPPTSHPMSQVTNGTYHSHGASLSFMKGKPACPLAPRGQRHTEAYKHTVTAWIKERTKGNKPTKRQLEDLLVDNFMRGKVFFRHPLNEEYEEATNLDPELWGTYTEWGKSLVPEAVIYNRLTEAEKEMLYDWPDRDIWKALFVVIWLRDYCDRHTRVLWYRACMRCQRGGWSCTIGHDMFSKNDIKHLRVKKGRESNACIPCRGSKASCSHAQLRDPLEEYGWATDDLEACWDKRITLGQLFALRETTSKGSGPFHADDIPAGISDPEDLAFEKAETLAIKSSQNLPPIEERTTRTPHMRSFIDGRTTRRVERAKAIADPRYKGAAEHKKLLMIQYLAHRIKEGTLTDPAYPWKDYERSVRELEKKSRDRKGPGKPPVQPAKLAPYPDFYDFWMGRGSTSTPRSEMKEEVVRQTRGRRSTSSHTVSTSSSGSGASSKLQLQPPKAEKKTPLMRVRELSSAPPSSSPRSAMEPTPALSENAIASPSPLLQTPDMCHSALLLPTPSTDLLTLPAMNDAVGAVYSSPETNKLKRAEEEGKELCVCAVSPESATAARSSSSSFGGLGSPEGLTLGLKRSRRLKGRPAPIDVQGGLSQGLVEKSVKLKFTRAPAKDLYREVEAGDGFVVELGDDEQRAKRRRVSPEPVAKASGLEISEAGGQI